ncbi:hypothetical protein BDZ91DRAFT_730577 [Kalaharituber pfeilii]|nr:hypothetical protein BDZ91DRAFT_730577 [Kalaharituber pfeilii]
MNRQGPGPQAMRSLGFSTAASSRMPNGKLGPSWGPPGVPNPQSRPNLSLSFSQSVSGMSQPATPLDLSEFPALTPQGPTQAAQAWNRISTQSPSQGRPTAEDLFQGHLGGGGLDDFRLPTQQQPTQQQSSLMHPNSLDEFPALPRAQNGAHLDLTQPEGHQQARNAFMSAGMGNLQQQQNQQVQAQAQARQQQQSAALRQSLVSPANMQNVGAPPQTSRLLPTDVLLQQQQQQQSLSSLGEQDKKGMGKSVNMMGTNGAPGLHLNINSNVPQQPPIQSQNQQQQQQLTQQQQMLQQQGSTSNQLGPLQNSQHRSTSMGVGNNSSGITNRQSAADYGETRRVGLGTLTGLSDSDRYGLNGLTEMIKGDNQDMAMLALGTDLTQLGLDLSQPDSSNVPLWAGFASPFADLESKPIEPEFTLPQCYSVSNIQPLSSKVANFSDETLFYIFYTMPQDIMQEVVATELTSRNWRYHTGVRLWLTKEPGSTPTQLSDTSEKGTYIFWDPTIWDRHRREWILDYTMLEKRKV